MKNNSMPHGIVLTLRFTAMLCGLAAIPVAASDVPDFPGAEGFGVKATGIRGGRVIADRTVAIPNGYATQNGGTTGGGSATPVSVSTASAFRTAVKSDDPAVIVVEGRIDLGGSVSIGSNKTIMGAETSSGLHGGRINVGGQNCIFQNLTLGPTDGDIMEISGGKNVFIHKCEFVDCTDESLSIVRGAGFVTVSWCKFHFTESHSHAFGHLIGNRTDRNSPGNNYCIGVGHESKIRVENCHFDNVSRPWTGMDANPGEIGWTGLKFEGCSQPTFTANAFPVFTPPYAFSMDPVDEVKSIVTAGAGNVNVP